MLSTAQKMNDLIDDNLEEVIRKSKALHQSLHGNNMPNVVCTENIDTFHIPTLELVEVICGIGKRVRWLPATTHQHTILVIAKIRRTKPDSAILVINNAPVPELLKNPVIPSILDKMPLREPCVE